MKRNTYIAFVFLAVMFMLAGSLTAHACRDGYFRDFSGKQEVRLNTAYTYSVFAEGEFKNINFSATGGEVLKTWNDGNKYFAEVRWTQNDPNDPTKLKVYGEDGCDNMQDLRYMMNVRDSRSPDDDEDHNNNNNSSNGSVRFFDRSSGKGKSFVAVHSMPKLASRWNDNIRSVWVGEGITLIIYEHANYKGESVELNGSGNGTLFNLSDFGFDNAMSSFEID